MLAHYLYANDDIWDLVTQKVKMNRTTSNRMPLVLCLWALTSLLAGCDGGKTLVPVTGSLVVDGQPAGGATLLFHPQDPKGSLATATTDASGNFSLVSDLAQGVATGSYKVCVIWPDPAVQPTPAQKMTGMFDAGPDLLKGRYESPEKSTLVIEISGSSEKLPPIELSAK